MNFELHHKAEKWHRDFIRWAEKHEATNTDEYKITKYALECIQMRGVYEKYLRQQKGVVIE